MLEVSTSKLAKAFQRAACSIRDRRHLTTHERWLTRKEYTRIRAVADLPENDDVLRLTKQMKAYTEWHEKNGAADPYFHRKSNRVVLALLHLDYAGSSQFVRGINTEVSLPTGTLCAERAAVVHARTAFPKVTRQHMKGIAVIEVPFTPNASKPDIRNLNNPLPPCGACREWLEKIQEESPEFYVLTYPDLTFSEVHERFLFWSVQEESMQPADVGPWQCRKCKNGNMPFSSICRACNVRRFSAEYNQAPTQQRYVDVLQALQDGGPMTHERIVSWLKIAGKNTIEGETSKTLDRLEKNGKEDPKTLKIQGRLISRSADGVYSITETGSRMLLEGRKTKSRLP